MSKFKVGDRVKSGFNRLGTVIEVEPRGYIRVNWDDWSDRTISLAYHAEYLILDVPDMNEKKLKKALGLNV